MNASERATVNPKRLRFNQVELEAFATLREAVKAHYEAKREYDAACANHPIGSSQRQLGAKRLNRARDAVSRAEKDVHEAFLAGAV